MTGTCRAVSHDQELMGLTSSTGTSACDKAATMSSPKSKGGAEKGRRRRRRRRRRRSAPTSPFLSSDPLTQARALGQHIATKPAYTLQRLLHRRTCKNVSHLVTSNWVRSRLRHAKENFGPCLSAPGAHANCNQSLNSTITCRDTLKTSIFNKGFGTAVSKDPTRWPDSDDRKEIARGGCWARCLIPGPG